MAKRKNKQADALLLAGKVRALNEERGLDRLLLAEPLVVGVSGGADSLALLHLLLELRGEKARETLHVGHLDHGFRGQESAQDAEYVAAVCRKHNISYTLSAVDVPDYAASHKLSQEDAARRVRYAFLGALAVEKSATVAVAHTADDQAETVLMNILRGTGISGLGGMRWLAQLPQSIGPELPLQSEQTVGSSIDIYRPLLGILRKEVEAYCEAHSLVYRVDATNLDTTYLRNRVRHELLPLLESDYNPSIKKNLWQLGELAASEDEAIEALIEDLWERAVTMPPSSNTLLMQKTELTNQPDAAIRRLVRRGLRELAGTLEGFEHKHIETASRMLTGRPDVVRSADLPHGISADYHGGVLYLRRAEDSDGDTIEAFSQWPVMPQGALYQVAPGSMIRLDARWTLDIGVESADQVPASGTNFLAQFDMDNLSDAASLVIRPRKPGDYITPMGLVGRKSLQDLFVDAKIPRYIRDRLPLLTYAEQSEILWVPGPGGRRSAHALINKTTQKAIRFSFEQDRDSNEGENRGAR